MILDILVEAARACEDTEQEGRQRMKRSGANSALRNFLGSEAAGGVLLMLTAALAMIVANINEDLYRVYHDLLHAPIGPTLSSKLGPMSLHLRSEEHTSELPSLMRISYAVFCLKKKTTDHDINTHKTNNNIKIAYHI